MSNLRSALIGLCVAGAPLGVLAQTAGSPAAAVPPAAAPKQGPATPAMPPGRMAGMARMDEHMKAMQAMHEKMAAAGTPEARQALMAEHMKLMRDGMGMMKTMGGGMQAGKGMSGSMAERQQMMEKRMDMMESMMQMMMDRMPPVPTT